MLSYKIEEKQIIPAKPANVILFKNAEWVLFILLKSSILIFSIFGPEKKVKFENT